MSRFVSLTALALALAGPAAAQVTTSIVADTAAGLATGTTITRAGALTTIDGGVRSGGNLFHSFTTFSLGTGEAAAWTAANPAGVANVINRVTGGELTTIAGTLDTRGLPNADFYFINPAGILFTAGARIAVPNAAHFSTGAGGLRFADGTTFAALLPQGASFSAAAPESFGFLGQENGLVIDGVDAAFTTPAVSLFLAAPNIGIRAEGFSLNSLDLVTTGGGAATIALSDPLGSAPLAGETLLIGPKIFAMRTGAGAPSVRVATGSFTQLDGILSSTSFFEGDAGDLFLRARDAEITGIVASDTSHENLAGDAGTVFVAVDSLHVHSGGLISSSTYGAGDGGAVMIRADEILLEGNALVTTDSFGAAATGEGGEIDIEARRITVRDSAIISSSASGFGDAGSIRIRADGLLVDHGIIDSVALSGSGNGGEVNIDARLLEVRDKGSINSSSFSAGDAGTMNVTADRILLRDSGNISSAAFGSGAGGPVSVTARTDLVVADGFISSDTFGSSNAGSISITAGSVTVRDLGLISSSTGAAGSAGQVLIVADTVRVDGGSQVRSQANNLSTGDAGSVEVTAGRVEVLDASIISSGSFGGNAGLVSITADDVVLEAGGIVSRVLPPAFGDAGQVVIRATNLSLDFGSLISSSTDSSGDAGGVTITASRLNLDNFSNIESGAARGSSGNGGTVRVTTNALTMRGTSSIITSTLASGNAGELIVTAGEAQLEAGSNLSSAAQDGSTGHAGSIDYEGDTLRLSGGARIATSTAGAGDAGDIRAEIGSIVLASGGGFASSADAGGSGRSGTVDIGAGELRIEAGGLIETNSTNANDAGDIALTVRRGVLITGEGAHIASENLSVAGGAAGSISLSGAPIQLVEGGFISTNSVAGRAGDITLSLPADSLLILEGRAAPGVITTSSGPGTGGRITISDPLAVISNGGRILALGEQRGANVRILSDFFIRSADRANLLSVDGDLVLDSQVSDVSAGVATPDVSFLDASGVLRGQCPAARSGGVTSQLSLRPFGPYAAEPDGRQGSVSTLPQAGAASPAGCR